MNKVVKKIYDSYDSHKIAIDFESIGTINKKSIIYYISKRILDIMGSLLGLILLSPILLIVSILIKLEDPKGSIFFTQERNGIYPITFRMYKFRSMVHNAEQLLEGLNNKNEQTGPVFKMKNDPRITKVGKILRKTSIDELPQLFNVLKGEMSLVGPRPPLPREVKEYTDYQMQRLSVKPGITCIWQVGGRNSVDFEGWVDMDLEYIEKRSLWFDIKLIIKTIFVLFGDKNAS